MMYDPEKGGMGFYTRIDSSFILSFYLLEKSPNLVYVTNGHDIDVSIRRDALIDELLSIAEALDKPSNT